MNRSEFLSELKSSLCSGEGCRTITTAEKKEGFTLRNRHDIKWGQVDANGIRYVRVVIDLVPGFLDESSFAKNTGLTITPPHKVKTGYRYTKKYKKDGHDQLILFLEDSFFERKEQERQAVFTYAESFSEASHFKTHASR